MGHADQQFASFAPLIQKETVTEETARSYEREHKPQETSVPNDLVQVPCI